jgi:hypothetical protein
MHMQIQARLVSVRKHTIGYVVDRRELTRNEAVREARRGRIINAKVVNNAYGTHLMGIGQSLYSLPSRFPNSRRFASQRSR